jgi:CRISPR-associated endonuclease/helicase Cas3
MTPELFRPFYQAVHGHAPFPWQERLLRQVVTAGWPEVLDLPTASGKTSSIDVAVFALAMEGGLPLRERRAPLRIFFVIDRRLVVDQAHEHALRLKQALDNPSALTGSPDEVAAVGQVAEALWRFTGGSPLHVAALRGGMYRDDSWAKAPHQPTVCVSTVDQVGSRLLFRGYGLSEYAWPVHAALTGNDALFLVDEAHLSQPFLETLRAVGQYRNRQASLGPFGVVEISATASGTGERLSLEQEDRQDPELRRRLAARKPTVLLKPTAFEKEAAELAVKARTGDVKVVGIVVNRVASARTIFDRLPGEPFEDKVLLTGRIRPTDRDALLARCLGRMRAGRTRTADDRPLFVAATMTVEVGADLDFDYLITEAAPLPALRQRFGRLDRLGRFGSAAGAILLRKAKGPDPVYGEELNETWKWLEARAAALDFGIEAFEQLLQDGPPPPAPLLRHAPVLLPAYLDAWVQTSPAPQPSPDVAPFLHGGDALEAADVQVVWRADLVSGQEDDWLEIVSAAPPRSRESLAVPVGAVRRWLRGASTDVADIEGVSVQDGTGEGGRPVLRWRGPDSTDSCVVEADAVRPGDTVVVPSEYGGADAFGWDPSSLTPVTDVGDLVVNEMANIAPDDGRGRLVRVRLHPAQVGEDQAGTLTTVRSLLEQGEDYGEALARLCESLIARPSQDPLTVAVLSRLVEVGPRVTAYPAGIILSGHLPPRFVPPPECTSADTTEEDTTDEDDTSSLRAGTYRPVRVELAKHMQGVTRWLRSFAELLGVGEELLLALTRAAELHDLGKADPRFQFLLYGDEPDGVLLAKSGRDLDARERNEIYRLSGLPRGFRHEFVSISFIRRQRDLLDGLNDRQGELAEYLIGTHHGRGRPFVPVIDEPAGVEPVRARWGDRELSASPDHRLWHLKEGWADRFWALVSRHGHWGLAYLEAVLRLADGACSAEEQHGGTKS